MGIDYYACEHCGDTFPDVGSYESCNCGRVWCDDNCAETGGLLSDEWGEDSTCKYCREEEFDDEVLLDFVLKRENISREDLIQLYKRESK